MEPIKLILPDNSVVGTNIKDTLESIATELDMPKEFFHPWTPTSMELPKEIECRIEGKNYTFIRADDLSYLADRIPTYDAANIDFCDEKSGRTIRLIFRREEGDTVVLSGMEYHPHLIPAIR